MFGNDQLTRRIHMETNQLNLRVTNNVTEKDISEIYNGLHKFNTAHSEPCAEVPIGIFYENEDGEKLAGLTGATYGNWLCIKYLWVSDSLRNQCIGSSILSEAEKEAVRRGCKYAFVDTFQFQAPEFYKKYGYEEVFLLKEYPFTGARHYYTKVLAS